MALIFKNNWINFSGMAIASGVGFQNLSNSIGFTKGGSTNCYAIVDTNSYWNTNCVKTGPIGNWVFLIDNRKQFRDFKLKVRTCGDSSFIHFKSDGGLGISDGTLQSVENNTYIFSFTYDGYAVVDRFMSGTSVRLSTVSAKVEVNEKDYYQTVICSGNSIKTYINDVLHNDIIDSKIASGFIGYGSLDGGIFGETIVESLYPEDLTTITLPSA
jgi:hypothetical protein